MIITLTTDFGLSDPFVGIMKGVILGIAPHTQVVDISHDVGSYDILETAFLVNSAFRYFPAGTIHVVVVDPGVGSARRPVAALSRGQVFIAPDNGVLSYVLNDEADAAVFQITNDSLFLSPVSRTFHGRDIFAPVAAHLAKGVSIESVGRRITDFVKKPVPKPMPQGDKIVARVMRIDKFGNIITNLKREDLKPGFSIHVAGFPVTLLYETFSDAAPGECFAFEGSTGYIELAMKENSAAERLNVKAGAEINVETVPSNQ